MIAIPEGLRTSVSGAEGGDEWLQALPDLAARAVDRWKLTLGQPFEGGMSSWAAPAQTAEGEAAVLKLSYPHTEARHEAAALRIWPGAAPCRSWIPTKTTGHCCWPAAPPAPHCVTRDCPRPSTCASLPS